MELTIESPVSAMFLGPRVRQKDLVMAQSVAAIMFTVALLLASGLIAMLLLDERNAVRRALGIHAYRAAYEARLRVRATPARRAVMVRLVPGTLRRAA